MKDIPAGLYSRPWNYRDMPRRNPAVWDKLSRDEKMRIAVLEHAYNQRRQRSAAE